MIYYYLLNFYRWAPMDEYSKFVTFTYIGGTFGKLMGSIFSSAITTGGLTVLILSAIMGEKEEA